MAAGQLLNQSGRENSSTQEPPRQLRTGKFCSFAQEQLHGEKEIPHNVLVPSQDPSAPNPFRHRWAWINPAGSSTPTMGLDITPHIPWSCSPAGMAESPPAAPRGFLGVNPSPHPATEIHCLLQFSRKKLNCSAGERKGKPDTFPSSNTTLEENQLKSKEPLPRVPRLPLLQPGGFGAGAPGLGPSCVQPWPLQRHPTTPREATFGHLTTMGITGWGHAE